MPKFHWLIWLIIIVVIIGVFPGVYFWLIHAIGTGVHTVCQSCTGHG